MEENVRKSQNIIVEDRKKFILTGIRDVISFDEETVMLDTHLGRLAVKGEELKLGNFDTNKGEISGTGKIHALIYTAAESGGGLFSRIFK